MHASDEAFVDPISLEPLALPVLASDGVTYSFQSLRAAMAADPWHRSPVKQDVLRALAFPNGFIADYLGIPTLSAAAELFDARTAQLPADARWTTLTLPVALDSADVITRAQWKLPIETVALRVLLRRTSGAEFHCMHPPPAVESFAAFEALGNAFGLGFTTNPACITSARLRLASLEEYQVEAWFVDQVLARAP